MLDVTRSVVRLQTGYLYHYAFAMLIGVAGADHLVHVRLGGPLMSASIMTWPILSVVTFLPLVGALAIFMVRGSDEAAQAQRALDRAVDHADHLRGVADPGAGGSIRR